jgi:hypothetical protein
MIARIRGILLQKSPTSVLIETGGIGFQLHIPVSSMNAIGEPGQEVQLFTVLHVREDALQLSRESDPGWHRVFCQGSRLMISGPRFISRIFLLCQAYRALEERPQNGWL